MHAENRRRCRLCDLRGVKPRRIDSITRIALTILSGFFDWRDALVVVRPETLIRWHRAGWRLFWRLKFRPGRPPIPAELQALIRRIANESPSWGEERIANELLLKIGIRVSPRTVNKYLPRRPRGRPRVNLCWSAFLRLHAQGIIACDFFVAVTATFRLLYVFSVIEHHSRRLIHCNVTAHPSAAWTLQQLREAVGFEEQYAYLLHDRDSIFAKHLDDSIGRLGVKVLKSPPRSPMANAFAERFVRSIKEECLNRMIFVGQASLRHAITQYLTHYHGERNHQGLENRLPKPCCMVGEPRAPVKRRERLGGMLSFYYREAA
jgi:transposase InsO family protein